MRSHAVGSLFHRVSTTTSLIKRHRVACQIHAKVKEKKGRKFLSFFSTFVYLCPKTGKSNPKVSPAKYIRQKVCQLEVVCPRASFPSILNPPMAELEATGCEWNGKLEELEVWIDLCTPPLSLSHPPLHFELAGALPKIKNKKTKGAFVGMRSKTSRK